MTLEEYQKVINFNAKIFQTISSLNRMKEEAILMTNGSAEILADPSYTNLNSDIKSLYELALAKFNAFKG